MDTSKMVKYISIRYVYDIRMAHTSLYLFLFSWFGMMNTGKNISAVEKSLKIILFFYYISIISFTFDENNKIVD
jgi:uncharacterized protein YqhQ